MAKFIPHVNVNEKSTVTSRESLVEIVPHSKAVQKVVESLRAGGRLYQDGLKWFGYLNEDDPTNPTRYLTRRVNEATLDKLKAQGLIVEKPYASKKKRRQWRKQYILSEVAASADKKEIEVVAEATPSRSTDSQ